MTTVRHAASRAGSRNRRRRVRRREELLVGLVILVVLAVTLLLLGLQWLDGGSPSSAMVLRLAPTHGGLT